MSGELHRLFIAVELEREVFAALAAAQEALTRAGAPRLRWVRPEGIHLTLKFLGETLAERIPALEAALEPALTGLPGTRVRLGDMGSFGGRSPRVVWVGLQNGLAALAALQSAVEKALAPLGFAPEERPFRPHLTLARVPPGLRPAERRKLAEVLRSAPGVEPVIIPVTEVSLMESRLTAEGALYQRLRAFPLRPSEPA